MPMKIPNVPSMCPEFHITYSLEGEGWRVVQRHMNLWGRRFAEVEVLDEHHVIVNFYPSRDRKWARWEEYRKEWIYGELARTSAKPKGKA